MTYQKALDYLYSQLPVFSRIGPAAYKKDIHNTVALCEALGNPQNKFKSIHIAGTNGKGSTSHMLAAILQKQGYRTGLYTSPHIWNFGERIRINGEMIHEDFVIDFTLRTIDLCKHIKPSFFELTVAMAFEYFSKMEVDIAVIETGLGGRLDSTNIILPILSIITNIGMDHMTLLGDNLESIAFEKAGIIKPDIPVVIGETMTETLPVFRKKASETNSTVFYSENLFHISNVANEGNITSCHVVDAATDQKTTITLDLGGRYQLKNLRTVWTAVRALQQSGISISETTALTALSEVRKLTGLRGRWEIVSYAPTIIFDVAHNKDGISAVCRQLDEQYRTSTYHFVMGFVNDKDIKDILKILPENAHYYFTNAHIPRALNHEKLRNIAAEFNLKGESFDDVNLALQTAQQAASIDDVIIVCGSFFILSEIDQHY